MSDRCRSDEPNRGRTFETGKCYRVRDTYFKLVEPLQGRWGYPNWWALVVEPDRTEYREAIPNNAGYRWEEVGEDEFLCALLEGS